MPNKEADYRWMWMTAKRRLMLAAEGKVKSESIGSYAAQDALRMLEAIEQQEYFGSDWDAGDPTGGEERPA